MDYIIGSGPAGIACAKALVAAGRRVTMLDSGLQLEPGRVSAIHQLQALDRSQWGPTNTAFLRDGVSAGASGIPLKLAYGSDFPYRTPSGATAIHCSGTDTRASHARGGFSTVWGASALPYLQQDIEDWPITVQDLEPGYRAVLEWMPLSAREDELAEFFPLYTDRAQPLPSSRQAIAFAGKMQRNRRSLNASGVHWGTSRIAVSAQNPLTHSGCVQCGLCMYGCPHELIYSSDQTLAGMIQATKIEYRAGVTVQSVEESASGVEIHAVNADGSPISFSGARVYLGAGLLNTTAILMRSLNLYETPVQIKDSQYFLMPLLFIKGVSGATREPLHTLAQLFVEIWDSKISPHTIHLQTYTYNDLYQTALAAALGPLRSIFPAQMLLDRLLLFQGYLHSSHSATINARLVRTPQSEVLELDAEPNPTTRKLINKLAFKLMRLAAQTGVMPLFPMTQVGLPGRGFHSGGSFPMTSTPGSSSSDILGRPCGMQRIHAIDSTVLPSVPATTITFTVMANAYRIASLAAKQFAGDQP